MMRALFILSLFQLLAIPLFAQTESFKQASNEIDFNHDLSKKWGLELNLGQTWSSKAGGENVFSNFSQFYVRLWVNFVPDEKWKLTFFYAYYYNENVPEIDQTSSPEWRSAVQATYYFKHGKPTVSTRWRIEDRHIQNADTVFEAVERLRAQIKMIYPFNGTKITKGTWYGILSDELMFKTKSKVSGTDLFDRNKVTAGIGYGITKNFQVELTYCNEFLPRTTNKSYNTFQFNAVLNNFFQRLNHAIFSKNKKNETASAD